MNRTEGKIIPFEYNYFLGISLYKKLINFQNSIMPLHQGNQIGIYSFSNIIPTQLEKKNLVGSNGLNIERGYIIFRTLNENIKNYLRLGVLEDPEIRIKDTKFKISRIEDIKTMGILSNNIKFKTLSPVLVRNYAEKNKYVSKSEDVKVNLTSVLKYQLKTFFGFEDPKIELDDLDIRPKTVRISANGKKESITKAFNITGKMIGDLEILNILYHKGLGSKSALGLGCWEVIA